MNGLGLDDWLREDRSPTPPAPGRRWSSSAWTCPAVHAAARGGARNPEPAPVDGRHVRQALRGPDRDGAAGGDPADAAGYQRQAAAYETRLEALDACDPGAGRDDPGAEPQDRHLPRCVSLLRAASTGSDRRRCRRGARPGSERGEIAALIEAIKAAGREGDLQRGPVPDEARRPARGGDRRQGRRRPLRRLARRPAGDDATRRVMRWDVEQLVDGSRVSRDRRRRTADDARRPAPADAGARDRPPSAARRHRGLRRPACARGRRPGRPGRIAASPSSARTAAARARCSRSSPGCSSRGAAAWRCSARPPAARPGGSPTCRRPSSSTGRSRSASGTS